MSLESARKSTDGRSVRERVLPALLAIVFIAGAIALYGGSVAASANATTPLNNVQVSLLTTSSLTNSYDVYAYNMTGGLVASYQSQYPGASFELPDGGYIFTATATEQGAILYVPGVATAATGGGPVSSGSGSSTAIICCVSGTPSNGTDVCCPLNYPDSEYGYATLQVSGSTSLTISTKPLNETTLSDLTINVRYPNGTAASGVYLSASVLGDDQGWAFGSDNLSLSGSTGSDGSATLVVPAVPTLVTASVSIPIVLPSNQTTFQITVAGVKVNVTAYWEPQYLSFTGQALIIPPQTGASITLQYQQSSCVIPYGTAVQSSVSEVNPTSATNGSQGTAQFVCSTVYETPAGSQPPSPAQTGTVTTQTPTQLSPATSMVSPSTRTSDSAPQFLFSAAAAAAVVAFLACVAFFLRRAHARASHLNGRLYLER